MKHVAYLIGTLFLAIALAACHSGGIGSGDTIEDETTSSTPVFTEITGLPTATGAMASAVASASTSRTMRAATTGRGVLDTVSSDVTTSMSRGACETINLLQGSLTSAARADTIPCYVKYLYATGALADRTIDDGNWHIFSITTDAENVLPDLLKLRVVKGDDDAIDAFTLYACSGGQQIFYEHQGIEEATLSIRGVLHADGFDEGDTPTMHAVDINGTLDANGAFTEKEIGASHRIATATIDRWMESVLTQTPGQFLSTGYRSYAVLGEEESSIVATGIASAGELLHDTQSGISPLTMGDGSAHYAAIDGTGAELASGIESWLGDDLSLVEPASSGSFYALVTDRTPTVAALEAPALAFASGETWDCSDDVGVGVTSVSGISSQAVAMACGEYLHEVTTFACPAESAITAPPGCAQDSICSGVGATDPESCAACYPFDAETASCISDAFCEEDEECIEQVGLICSGCTQSTTCAVITAQMGELAGAACNDCYEEDNPLSCLLDMVSLGGEETITAICNICNGGFGVGGATDNRCD